MEERIEAINGFIKKVMKKDRAFIREQSLAEDLGLNSIQFIELIALIEEKYDVIVPMQKLQAIKRVGDLYNAVVNIENFCRV
jgi:acyl carrier protein